MNLKIIKFNDKIVIMKGLMLSMFFLFLFFIPSSYALKNPASVYCGALGFTSFTNTTDQGETDYCQISSSLSVDSWKFLQGKVAQEFSYCKKMGYDIKTVTDITICERLATEECAVCIFPNKTEVEVTKLMNLDFREGKCGDGPCAIGETYFNCPQDCPSGSIDIVCDKVKDGICDPDCVRLDMRDQDPDCVEATTTSTMPEVTTTLPLVKPSTPIYVYLIAIGIIVALVIFLISKIKIVK